MSYDYSVIVLTYNPPKTELFQTLYSIIIQKKISFEIIIADDGSQYNFFDEIVRWFKQNNVTDYKLIDNKTNQGTVKNFIKAYELAEGELIKAISPGDYLYSDETLFKFKKNITNDDKIIFGVPIYYTKSGTNCVVQNISCPIDISVYKKNNRKKIQRNYLLYRDYVLGAAFIWNKRECEPYLKIVGQLIKYCEDATVLLMLSEQNIMKYINEPIIWYENGTGISTSSSNKWTSIIYEENRKIYQYILSKNKQFEKYYNFNFRCSDNKFITLIRRIMYSPYYFAFCLKARFPKKLKVKYNENYLKAIRKQIFD